MSGARMRVRRSAVVGCLGCWLAGTCLGAAGCASSPATRGDEPLIHESEAQELAPARTVAAPGTLRRADVQRVLAGSPGQFLAGIDMVPELAGKAFRGWRIRAFFPGDPQVHGAVRPGDVVLKVNDHALERPDQFIEIWQAAGARNDLTVDLLRDGKPLRLAWRIIDEK